MWVVVTIAAAFLQVARTGLQKSLASHIDPLCGAWVRSAFALPLLPLLAPLMLGDNRPAVILPPFYAYCAAAAAAQIIATALLLALFGRRNFVTSTAFAKTEGLQTALLGVAVFAEPPSAAGAAGIALGAAGAALLIPWRRTDKSALFGLGAGLFFALTAWFVRQSYHFIEAPLIAKAMLCLTLVVLLQAAALGAYLFLRRANFGAVWRERRRAAAVGALSLAGSVFWYWAFALANPAYVKTLAQIELALAYALGKTAFAEKPSRTECIAIALAALGAVLVALA